MIALRTRLRAAGLELARGLDAERYDALVPDAWKLCEVAPTACSVWLVLHGGREFWARARAADEVDESDWLDHFTRRSVREAAPHACFASYAQRRGGAFAPLQRLAEAAGLGRMGRIDLLLHPRYGPWCSLRGLLYLEVQAPAPLRSRFDPCTGCAAPCQGARDPRRACVLGRDHVYCRDQRDYHARAAEAYRNGVP